MANANSSDLNISLESHLIDVLRPLLPMVPPELAASLSTYLSPNPPATIPYSILHSVSRWSRTARGLKIIHDQSPTLDPSAYSMVSLLAGTTTSPERKFGAYTPAKEPEELEAEKKKERKAITALLNALLSIGGSGVATWWAADKTGWQNEWKVLLSFFVAVVVAVSEAILYIIWQSRRSTSGSAPRRTRHRLTSAKHKKDDGDSHLPDTINPPFGAVSDGGTGLRRRQ